MRDPRGTRHRDASAAGGAEASRRGAGAAAEGSHDAHHRHGEPEVFDREIHVQGIVWFGIFLIILIVVAGAAMWGLSSYLKGRQEKQDLPVSPLVLREGVPPVPEPHLQTTPEQDLRALRAHEDSLLHSYGWVDAPAGIARIPVQRAMELLLEQGLPTRSAPRSWTPPGEWRDPSLQRLPQEEDRP